MGEKIHIVSQFGKHEGRLVTDSGASVALGRTAEKFAPYELLLGALSYCLFRTFESLAEKMKLSYEGMDMHIEGVKRDDKIQMLETCHIKVEGKGASDKDLFTKVFEIATRYCSVFNTLSKVASMSWEVRFV